MHGPIRMNFKLSLDYSCPSYSKNEDLIKTDGARVFTTLYIYFLDAQGQVTPYSSCEHSSALNFIFDLLHSCRKQGHAYKLG